MANAEVGAKDKLAYLSEEQNVCIIVYSIQNIYEINYCFKYEKH